MPLMRWDPFREVMDIQRSLHRLIDDRAENGETFSSLVRGFPVDMFETADEIVVRAEVPGVREDDINVEVTDRTLNIEVQREERELPEGVAWHRRETMPGYFKRSFSLHVPIEADQIQASYAGGVLQVRMPKAENFRPKRIPVSQGGELAAEAGESTS